MSQNEEGSPDSDRRTHLSLARPANSSLFIRNVADRTTTEELRDIFRRFGRLFDVYIPKDYYSKKPRGFAYVQFEEAEDAIHAQEKLNFVQLHGRQLEVDFAKGDRKTPYEMKAQELEEESPGLDGRRSSRHRHHHHHHHRHGHDHRHHHHEHHRSRSDDRIDRNRHRHHSHGRHHHHHHNHHRSSDTPERTDHHHHHHHHRDGIDGDESRRRSRDQRRRRRSQRRRSTRPHSQSSSEKEEDERTDRRRRKASSSSSSEEKENGRSPSSGSFDDQKRGSRGFRRPKRNLSLTPPRISQSSSFSCDKWRRSSSDAAKSHSGSQRSVESGLDEGASLNGNVGDAASREPTPPGDSPP